MDDAVNEALKSVKIVDPVVALWTNVKNRVTDEIKNLEDQLMFSKEVLKLAESKINEVR